MTTATNVVWRRLMYAMAPQLDIYKSLAGRLAGRRVLEVGFGTGLGTLQYAQGSLWVDAIEIDGDAVEFARSTLPLKQINWIKSDLMHYNPKKCYDAVVMIEVLDHMAEPEVALKRVAELLDTDGLLYASAPNANADLRKNALHQLEFSAQEYGAKLLEFFDRVWLYDYSLTKLQNEDSTTTPLVAVARGPKYGEPATFNRRDNYSAQAPAADNRAG